MSVRLTAHLTSLFSAINVTVAVPYMCIHLLGSFPDKTERYEETRPVLRRAKLEQWPLQTHTRRKSAFTFRRLKKKNNPQLRLEIYNNVGNIE